MTQPPPPPVVVDLSADRDLICPGERVKVLATTFPADKGVTWDVVGGSFSDIGINEIEVGGNSGAKIEVRASIGTSSLSIDIDVVNTDVDFAIPDGPEPDGSYAISAGPKMPQIVLPPHPGECRVSVSFVANDCPPFGPQDLRTSADFGPQAGAIDFGDKIIGGSLGVSCAAEVGGCPKSFSGGAGIHGTNPSQSDIQTAIRDLLQPQGLEDRVDTLLRIACVESGQRQFDAPPNGGVAFCPLFGPDGKVGIMGIRNPTADDVWDWRANVAKGVARFNEIVLQATQYPADVRDSTEYNALVEAFNQKRIEEGKPAIDVQLPPFDKDQLDRDAIRGYDGWHEPGKFNLALHEYRVPTQEDGSLDVNESTGTVDWQLVDDRSVGDPDYVDRVLTFTTTCELLGPPPPPPPEEQLCAILESDSFTSNEVSEVVEQTIRIDNAEIYNDFDRLGHLSCRNPLAKIPASDPCTLKPFHHGSHTATLAQVEEIVIQLAKTHSETTQNTIKAGVEAEIEGKVGVPLLAEAKATLGTKLEFSRAWGDTDTSSMTIAVKNALTSTEKLEIFDHADPGFEIEIPWGLRVIVTIDGNVLTRRQWSHDAEAGICQIGDVEIIAVELTGDLSVEADFETRNLSIISSSRNETCP